MWRPLNKRRVQANAIQSLSSIEKEQGGSKFKIFSISQYSIEYHQEASQDRVKFVQQ